MIEVRGRNVSALLNPRPVVLVTTCGKDGIPNVLSVTWTTPVSHEPPILALSIAPIRHSHWLLNETGECVVNVVGQQLMDAVELCGKASGSRANKFAAAGLKTTGSVYVQPPRIDGALACLECRVIRSLIAGDHSLFIAQVLVAEADDRAFSDVWNTEAGDVLLCRQRDRFGICQKVPAQGNVRLSVNACANQKERLGNRSR